MTAVPHEAVCRVMVPEARGVRSWGSGVLVHKAADYAHILTAAHNVRDWDKRQWPVVIMADGSQFHAKVVAVNTNLDVALLAIRPPTAEPVSVFNGCTLKGVALTIHGYGSGQYRVVKGSVVKYCSVSSKEPIEWNAVRIGSQVRPGDSGGPMLDSQGRLRAIVWGSNADGACGTTTQFINAWLRRLGTGHQAKKTRWRQGSQQNPATCRPKPVRFPTAKPVITTPQQPSQTNDQLVTLLELCKQNALAIASLNLKVAENTEAIQTNHEPVSHDVVADLERRIAALEAAAITVTFEAGDEPDEPPRVVSVPIAGGTLSIPPVKLRMRNVMTAGETMTEIGEPMTDVAPLGQPLKCRNVIGDTSDHD